MNSTRNSATLGVALVMASLAACGGSESNETMDRDIALLPADSMQALSDIPLSDTLGSGSETAGHAATAATVVDGRDLDRSLCS
jgi:hypothetical protein